MNQRFVISKTTKRVLPVDDKIPIPSSIGDHCSKLKRVATMDKVFERNRSEQNFDEHQRLYCCNYAIGYNEDFIRIDPVLTRVSSEEMDDGTMLIHSTRIESGHSVLCPDIDYVECAGEVRLKYIGMNPSQNSHLFEVMSLNLQTSFFAFPDDRVLVAWNRFGVDGYKLYRTNYWENKGRSERSKYLP